MFLFAFAYNAILFRCIAEPFNARRLFALASPFFAPAVLVVASQRHRSAIPCCAMRFIAVAMPFSSHQCQRHSFLGLTILTLVYALPWLCLAYLCLRISSHVIAFAKLNITTLRSSFADLFSSFADRCATLHVNANANPLDSFPSRLQTLPCQCQTMRCHYSSKSCRCSTQPRHRNANLSLR